MKSQSSNTPKKVLQVRYRNPRNILEIFWAGDVFEFASSMRFVHCCTMRVATIEGTGLFKNFAVKLNSITIPITLTPTVVECDEPEWWNRTQEDAQAILENLARDPAAREIGQQMKTFTNNLSEWISQLNPTEQEKQIGALMGETQAYQATFDEDTPPPSGKRG
jgi:hypothetical protein